MKILREAVTVIAVGKPTDGIFRRAQNATAARRTPLEARPLGRLILRYAHQSGYLTLFMERTLRNSGAEMTFSAFHGR